MSLVNLKVEGQVKTEKEVYCGLKLDALPLMVAHNTVQRKLLAILAAKAEPVNEDNIIGAGLCD